MSKNESENVVDIDIDTKPEKGEEEEEEEGIINKKEKKEKKPKKKRLRLNRFKKVFRKRKYKEDEEEEKEKEEEGKEEGEGKEDDDEISAEIEKEIEMQKDEIVDTHQSEDDSDEIGEVDEVGDEKKGEEEEEQEGEEKEGEEGEDEKKEEEGKDEESNKGEEELVSPKSKPPFPPQVGIHKRVSSALGLNTSQFTQNNEIKAVVVGGGGEEYNPKVSKQQRSQSFNLTTIELQKEKKVDVNKYIEKKTLLYIACEEGYDDIVIELLKHPMLDVNKGHIYGYAPLHIACSNQNLEIVKKLLLHKDINVDIVDSLEGKIPEQLAKKKEISELFKEYRSNVIKFRIKYVNKTEDKTIITSAYRKFFDKNLYDKEEQKSEEDERKSEKDERKDRFNTTIILSDFLKDLTIKYAEQGDLKTFKIVLFNCGMLKSVTKDNEIHLFSKKKVLANLDEKFHMMMFGVDEDKIFTNVIDYIELFDLCHSLELRKLEYIILKKVESISDLKILFKMFCYSYRKYEETYDSKIDYLMELLDEEDDLNGSMKSSKKETFNSVFNINLFNIFKLRCGEIIKNENFVKVLKHLNLFEKLQAYKLQQIEKHTDFWLGVLEESKFSSYYTYLKSMLYKSRNQDYNLIICGKDGIEIKVHREILMIESDYFHKLLKDLKVLNEKDKVHLKQLSFKEIMIYIQFIYLRSIEIEKNDLTSALLLLIEISSAGYFHELAFENCLTKKVKEFSKQLIYEKAFLKEFENFAYLFHLNYIHHGEKEFKNRYKVFFISFWGDFFPKKKLIQIIEVSYLRNYVMKENQRIKAENEKLKIENEKLRKENKKDEKELLELREKVKSLDGQNNITLQLKMLK